MTFTILATLILLFNQIPAVQHTKITGTRTLGPRCMIDIEDDEGPLTLVVSWSDCEHLHILPMKTSELEAAKQLQGAAKYHAQFADERRHGEVVTIWGEFTAAFYFRSAGNFVREVIISD